MKKIYLILLSFVLYYVSYSQKKNEEKTVISSLVSQTLYDTVKFSNSFLKQSIRNKQWEIGGIFYGLNPSQEILELRTEISKKFDIGNGMKKVIIGGPFHYLDEHGVWQDIDLRIKYSKDSKFAFQNYENKFVSKYAAQHQDGIVITNQKSTLQYGINPSINAGEWQPESSKLRQNVSLSENIITYGSVFNDIDLEYELKTDAIFHRLKFNNKNIFDGIDRTQQFVNIEETIELPTNSILLDSIGIIASNRNTYGLVYVVVNGDSLFTILPSRIWDATFTGNIFDPYKGGSIIPEGFVFVKSSISFLSASRIKLYAHIPTKWLLESKRIYPIILDPTFSFSGTQYSGGSSSSPYAFPWQTGFYQRASQILVLQNLIGMSGTITDVSFRQNILNGISNQGATIRLKHTTVSSLNNGTFDQSWSTTHYGPSTLSFNSGGTGWRTITLGSSFSYNNSDNLLIEARFVNSSASANGDWYYVPTSYQAHRWGYCNCSNYPPTTTTYSGAPYYTPVLQFTINSASCSGWSTNPKSVNLASSASGGNTFKVTVTSGKGCSYSALSNNSWIKNITYPGLTDIVSYDVDLNSSGARTGTISVKDAGNNIVSTFTVYQSGASCGLGTPTSSATNIIFSTPQQDQLTFSWTQGNGQRRIIVAREGSPVASLPSNGIDYAFDYRFGYGEMLNTGEYVVYNDMGGSGVTVSNLNPNTTYYFKIFEYNCTGTNTKYLTSSALSGSKKTASSCTKPSTPSITSLTSNSGSISLVWTKVTGATYYVYYSSTGCNGPFLNVSALTNSATITGLSPNTNYDVYVTAFNVCESDYEACKSVKTASGPSISITSYIVPPWQREGDDLMGTINFNYSTLNIGDKIQVDIYVNGKFAGTKNMLTLTQTSGSGTFNFNFQTYTLLPNYPVEGAKVGYQVIEVKSKAHADVSELTTIIEKKWNKKNYYYNNNGNDNISIPMKYHPTELPTKAIISRFGDVSFRMEGTSLIEMESILYEKNGVKSGFTEIPINISNGYLILNNSNSNLKTVFPGDFKADIYSDVGWIETIYFDLTKFGEIFNGDLKENKVILMIGGIFNETEASIETLRTDLSSNNKDSKNSYSIISYLRNQLKNDGYGALYIAQGNANSVVRNGYDIGKAMDKILEINPNISEITLVCHSKGGLDVRGFLQDNTSSFDQSESFGISQSTFKNKIKNVIFLGTPHEGGNSIIVSIGILKKVNCPGIQDLDPSSKILKYLNKGSISSGIKILNLTGFVNGNGSENLYGISVLSDEVVPVSSSENPKIGGIQLYQNSDWDPTRLHMRLHKNITISKDGKCVDLQNNLDKIKDFIKGFSIPTCNHKITWKGLMFFSASILPHAYVELKSFSDSFYKQIGFTDAEGRLNLELFDSPSVFDSLRISADGIESITIMIDSVFIKTGMLRMVLFHSTDTSSKIQFPSVKIKNNQTPIVNTKSINLEVTAKNAIAMEINYPLYQDSSFIPLNILNNIATISLDSGTNNIIIRLIGKKDTVNLLKRVCYLTDSISKYFTTSLKIISKNQYVGAKLYAENEYYCNIQNNITELNIFKWVKNCRFSCFGYRDTIVKLDSTGVINLVMEPISYSSKYDSITFVFDKDGYLNYWKNMTIKKLDKVQNTSVTIKQFEDSFNNTGLSNMTRTFQFINTSLAGGPTLKAAICLDQIQFFDSNTGYLLIKYDKNKYSKIIISDTGICNYDPIVQKLSCNIIDFDSGRVSHQQLTVMKRLAPISVNRSFKISISDSVIIPYGNLFIDPDSIKNDIQYEILNPSQNGFTCSLSSYGLFIKPDKCYIGNMNLSLRATHDGIPVTHTFYFEVLGILPKLAMSGSANFCKGDSVILFAPKSNEVQYQWFKNNNSISQTIKNELVIHQEGNYYLTITDIQSKCSITSDTFKIVSIGNERFSNHCLKIYPNPTSGQIIIEMELTEQSNRIVYSLLNQMGQSLYEETNVVRILGNYRKSLSLNNQSNGVYFLKIKLNDNTVLIRKVVLQR